CIELRHGFISGRILLLFRLCSLLPSSPRFWLNFPDCCLRRAIIRLRSSPFAFGTTGSSVVLRWYRRTVRHAVR
ncbi:hypothetical protein PFISCL1PPCAC_4888, partial [Pristionchus fissidentatus]